MHLYQSTREIPLENLAFLTCLIIDYARFSIKPTKLVGNPGWVKFSDVIKNGRFLYFSYLVHIIFNIKSKTRAAA